MEGLIPYLLHAIKKDKPQQSRRHNSFSEGSTRSYHLLMDYVARESLTGSSHRRSRSEFAQPSSTSTDFPAFESRFSLQRSVSVVTTTDQIKLEDETLFQ
ncbi:unnamed protein product [Rhodiola kirilowii]